MPPSEDLRELLRITKENNRLLHKMRRTAFWGSIIKTVLYLVLFVGVPFWLYATYLGPTVEQTLKAYQQISGSGASSQAQITDLQSFYEQLKQQFSPQE
jgi:hypothetical protein